MIQLRSNRTIALTAGILLTLASRAGAQVAACNGNQDLAGHYAFAANRLGWVQVIGVPPGTTAAGPVWSAVTLRPPGEFSNTPLGRLVSGALSAAPVSSAGRILADGGGTLYALPGLAPAGTYTVQADCVVTIRLHDPAPPESGSTAAPVEAVFRGVLQGRGESAALVQINPGGGTHLLLTRPFLVSGCTDMSLSGGVGLALTGVAPGSIETEFSPPVVTPFSLIARIFADGEGNLIEDVGSANSAPSPVRYVGTYSVDSECTGTMTLSAPSAGGIPEQGTESAPPIVLRFVLTQGDGNRAGVWLVSANSMRFSGLGSGR